VTSLVLVPCIASKASIPVICAGGIANGQGLLAMLALGADGVAMVSGLFTPRLFAHSALSYIQHCLTHDLTQDLIFLFSLLIYFFFCSL